MSSRMGRGCSLKKRLRIINECEDEEVVKSVKLDGFGFRGLA
jgi:hypothetical protein